MVDDHLFPTDTGHNLHFIVLCWYLELFEELVECLRHFPRLVLLNTMADLVQDNQLELPLHLCNSQILVHSVTPGQQQLLGHSYIQEALSKALEPSLPERLCGHQVCSPHVLDYSSAGISHRHHLVGHGDSGAG